MPSLDQSAPFDTRVKRQTAHLPDQSVTPASSLPRGSQSGRQKRCAFVTPVSADPNDYPWVSEDVTRANERELNRFCSSCLLLGLWFGT